MCPYCDCRAREGTGSFEAKSVDIVLRASPAVSRSEVDGTTSESVTPTIAASPCSIKGLSVKIERKGPGQSPLIWNPDPNGTSGAGPPSGRHTYCPLRQPDEIRLLRILPPSTSFGVRCDIVHTVLTPASHCSYIALSYSWRLDYDNPSSIDEGRESILLNNSPKEVAENLYAGLQTLQDLCKDVSVLIWINVLCIDQENLDERSKQVQIMGRIYSCATNVIVWLGDETNDSRRTMTIVRTICSIEGENQERLRHKYFLINFVPLNQALFSRSWWTRIWVVQEFALARKGSCLVFVGKNAGQFDEFVRVVDPQWEYRAAEVSKQAGDRALADARAAKHTNDARARVLVHVMAILKRCRQHQGQTIEFGNLLILTRMLDASNPHDKIYALRGLATDHVGENDLVPNYPMKKLEEVYTDVVLFCVRTYASLNVICLVKFARKLSALPSWVPDFIIDPWNSTIARDLHRGFLATTGNVPNACGSKKLCHANITPANPKVLCVKGFCLDTICKIDHRFDQDKLDKRPARTRKMSGKVRRDDPDKPDQRSKSLFFSFLNKDKVYRETRKRISPFGFFEGRDYRPDKKKSELFGDNLPGLRDDRVPHIADSVKFIGGPYIGGVTTEEAVARTWIGNTCYGMSKVAYEDALIFWRELHAIYIFEYTKKFESFTEEFNFQHEDIATGRAPFLSINGYVGWAPAQAKKGDMLVILWGFDWPAVIRKRDNECYSVIGECYCHGTMNGEAVEAREKGAVEETFRLNINNGREKYNVHCRTWKVGRHTKHTKGHDEQQKTS